MPISKHLSKTFLLLPMVSAISLAENRINLEEIFVSASRVADQSSNIVGNQATIGSETIKDQAHQHIQQILVKIPGVSMNRNDGQEYLPALRSPVLAGAGACGSFLMAEDGISLRPAGFCNVNELFEAHSEQAQSIEVIRGPANALYGSNAMHGVINVISPASFERTANLELEVGPDNHQKLKYAWGNDSLALAFTGSSADSFRQEAGVDQQKISAKWLQSLDTMTVTTGLTAINLNQETAGYISGHEAYKDERLIYTNPNPEAYRDAQAARLWSRFESNDESSMWVLTPYIRYSRMDFLQHFLPGTPLEQNGQTSIGAQSAFYFDRDESRLIMGLDLEKTDGWLKQTQLNETVGSAFLVATIPSGKQYDYDVAATQIAPFIQWEWSPSDNLKWSAGLRYEYMSYDYDNLMSDGQTKEDGTTCGFGGCRYTRPADRKDSFNNWSPHLGMLYDLNDQQQFFVRLSQGFRAPQATELYRLQRAQVVADLDSEELQSLEMGLRGKHESLSYELAAYSMRKDNVIFRDTSFFNVSNGKTTHRGIELGLNYQLTPQLSLGVAASSARHRYDYSEILSDIDINGNDVDTAPRHFGTVDLTWKATNRSKLSAEWVHMGGYYTDPENLHRYAGHDIANLSARWKISETFSASARLLNVFDQRYAERADYSSFGGDRYFPGQPRSLYVSVEIGL